MLEPENIKMTYYLSIGGYEQEIELEALEKLVPILLQNGFGFLVRTKRK